MESGPQTDKNTDANRVHIFDTTLRDGEQSPGISLNTAEKVEIAQQLARLGDGIGVLLDDDRAVADGHGAHGPDPCTAPTPADLPVPRGGFPGRMG